MHAVVRALVGAPVTDYVELKQPGAPVTKRDLHRALSLLMYAMELQARIRVEIENDIANALNGDDE